MVVVGQIRGPHGVRGEVRVEPHTDIPERFVPGAVLDCEGVGSLIVKALRGAGHQPIVAFKGVDTREAAEKLKNRLLRVTAADARERVAAGAFLWRDLIGLAVVTPDGRELGKVKDLVRTGGADVLVIDGPAGELLLPMIDAVVRSVDVAAERIVAVPQEEL